mgnify:CR=1 FL=1
MFGVKVFMGLRNQFTIGLKALFLILIPTFAFSLETSTKSWVGKKTEQLVSELSGKDMGGCLFFNQDVMKAQLRYGVNEIQVKSDTYYVVHVSDAKMQIGKNAPPAIVLASLKKPKLKANEFLETCDCRDEKNPQQFILAISDASKEVERYPVRLAWVFDPVAKKLSERSTSGVTCENEGFGI